MKKIAFVIFVFLIASCAATKRSKAEKLVETTIRNDFMSYLELIVNSDFEGLTDYILPELFEIIPKEQLINAMELAFNNPALEFTIKEPKILDVGEVIAVEDKFYTKLTYSNLMDMKILEKEGEEQEDKDLRINLTKAAFESTFGDGNVAYDETTGFFQIYAKKEVIAISEDGQADWKFLVVEEEQRFLLERLIPEEVLKIPVDIE